MLSPVALPPGGQPEEFVQRCTNEIDGLINESNGRRRHMLTSIHHLIQTEINYVNARLGPSFVNSPESSEKRGICIKSEAFKSRRELICMAISF
jgi:hypothetical protein